MRRPEVDSRFRFVLPDHIVRTLTRAQYHRAQSWLRKAARLVRHAISSPNLPQK